MRRSLHALVTNPEVYGRDLHASPRDPTGRYLIVNDGIYIALIPDNIDNWAWDALMNAITDSALYPHPATTEVPAWKWHLLLLVILLATLGACYWSSFASIAATWERSNNFAHGILILPISLYMIWTCRDKLGRLQPNVNLWGLPPLLACVAMWFLARETNVLVVEQLFAVMMVPFLVLTTLGRRACWAIAFPLAYLMFAVPMGDNLVSPLMDLTAATTVKALQWTGIPVYMEGRFLHIPSGDWEVAEACSGARYLIASVALGAVYAYFTYRSYWRRLVFIMMAVVISITANAMRAYGIVMLGHLSGMRLAVGVDHLIYGWLFFGLVMFVLFWLGSRWQEPAETVEPQVDSLANETYHSAKTLVVVTLGALLILASGTSLSRHVGTPDNTVVGDVVIVPPAAQFPWRGPFQQQGNWQPKLVNADAHIQTVYGRDASEVALYIGRYRSERQGAELINSENRLYDETVWRRIGEAKQTVSLGNGKTMVVHETRLSLQGNTKLVWHWYHVAGHTTTDPVAAKLLSVWGKLSSRRADSTLVAIATDYEDYADDGRSLLRQFMADFYPEHFETFDLANRP